MSHLEYNSYPGVGESNKKNFHYSQSVRVGDTVYISGQEYPPTRLEQIDQAFKNIEKALSDSGATLDNVFKVVSYHIPLDDDSLERSVENMKKHFPNHEPLWTCVEVPRLGDPGMKIEIEVIAHIPPQ